MRLYIKSDFTKKITFTTRELVWKMWFKEWHGHPITYSNVGDDAMLQDDFFLVYNLINGDLMINGGIIYHMTRIIHGIRFLMKIFNWNLKMIFLLMGENVGIIYVSQPLIQMC